MRYEQQHPPTHNDADIVLRLYELRREPVLRDARKEMIAKFWPASFDELLAYIRGDHPMNAAYRQTTTYWELAFSMARYGIVNPEFLMESSGEGLLLFARVQPFLEPLRQAYSPRAFRNAEWIATNSETGQQIFAVMQKRVADHFAAR